MKGSFLGLGILGILLILFGIAFALQGGGMIGGSVMTGNPFWIYAGSGIAILGVILAFLGFYVGSRRSTLKVVAEKEKNNATTMGSASTSGSAPPKQTESHT